MTQAFLPMLRAARGRVVFMSSIGARRGLPYLSPYNASKAAIGIVGDSLRQEMRPFGVGVSVIEPGAIATPMWGKGEAEAPDIIAAMEPGLRALYGERLERMQGALGEDRVPRSVARRRRRGRRARAHRSKPKPRYVVGLDAKVSGGSPARCSPIAPWTGSSSASSTAPSSPMVALVTGASSGIGEATARRLARRARGGTGPGRAPRRTPAAAGERARRRDGDRRRPHGGRGTGADRRRGRGRARTASTSWSTTPARRGGGSLATAAGSTCANTWSSTSTPS